MNDLKIKSGKFYTTRDGRMVVIFRTAVDTVNRNNAILGAIITDGLLIHTEWDRDGRFFPQEVVSLFRPDTYPQDIVSEWVGSTEINLKEIEDFDS